MHVGREAAGSQFCWGVVSYTSLWNGSTDFHTLCETATKLDEEIDGEGNGKMFSSEDFLFIFLSLFLPFFRLSSFLSICAFPRLANEFLTVPRFSPFCLSLTHSVCKD